MLVKNAYIYYWTTGLPLIKGTNLSLSCIKDVFLISMISLNNNLERVSILLNTVE